MCHADRWFSGNIYSVVIPMIQMLKSVFDIQTSGSWHPLILVSLQEADVCGECFCTHLLIVMNYVYIVLHHSLQNGATPLIVASLKGHKDIVEVLLNHGAEVDLPHKVSVCVSYHYLVAQLSVWD